MPSIQTKANRCEAHVKADDTRAVGLSIVENSRCKVIIAEMPGHEIPKGLCLRGAFLVEDPSFARLPNAIGARTL